MEIEIFNTHEEKWNPIPEMSLHDVLSLGFSSDWHYYVWFRAPTKTAVIRVERI